MRVGRSRSVWTRATEDLLVPRSRRLVERTSSTATTAIMVELVKAGVLGGGNEDRSPGPHSWHSSIGSGMSRMRCVPRVRKVRSSGR